MLATQIKVTLSDNVIDLPTHKTCSKCNQSKLLSEFFKQKDCKYGVRSDCKQCLKEVKRVWYEANRESLLEKQKFYDQNNKERIKGYRESNKERKKEYDKDYSRVWRKANPDKVRSRTAKRRAAKKNAFPIWARTGEIKQQIDAIYKEAKDLELFHQTKYHVDHIHPLQSNFVCGLHVPANLQPLPGIENLTKNNSFIPYIEVATDVEIDLVELNKMVEEFNDSLAHNENLIYNVG